MNEYWENAVVYHNCPHDEFVMNGSETVKDYCFADGTIMRVRENELFFLPKDVKYHIRNIRAGGSYRITFALEKEVWEKPFTLKIRNYHDILKVFRDAVNVWQHADYFKAQCMKSVYEIILAIQKEMSRNYIPGNRGRMIASAIEEIRARFADHELSVSELARACGLQVLFQTC